MVNGKVKFSRYAVNHVDSGMSEAVCVGRAFNGGQEKYRSCGVVGVCERRADGPTDCFVHLAVVRIWVGHGQAGPWAGVGIMHSPKG